MEQTEIEKLKQQAITVQGKVLTGTADRPEVHPAGKVQVQPAPAAPELSAEDKDLLEVLEGKFAIVRDRTRSVAHRYTTGFFLYGTGGIGKSYSVLSELDRQKVDYRLHNSRMTGRGLYDSLAEAPDTIHVLEDMEGIYQDKNAQGVLRSALWGQAKGGRMERKVTWKAHRTVLEFVFTGGIIILSNRPLEDIPELHAVATRINPVLLQVTNRESAALMRSIALKGHRVGHETLAPGACLEVANFVIDESLALSRNLDMRVMVNSFSDRLQWEAGKSEADWRELVSSRLQERVVPVKKESRSARTDREREIAQSIKDLPRAERAARWTELTGLSEKALYRRLAEV
jgi:hypothetical protein